MASPMSSRGPSKRPRQLEQDSDSNLRRDGASKPLIRPRTIPYPWRSLLAVAVYAADASRVDVRLLDMANGAVVAQLDGRSNDGSCFGMSGGLLCSVSGTGNTAAIRVLDPATGTVSSVVAAAGTSMTAAGTRTSSTYVFGKVPKTGEHKVLRIYTSGYDDEQQQSCEILTLLGGREQSWRPAASPPVLVDTKIPRHRAVTHGVVHFMTPDRAEYDGIVSFDLATEKWKPSLLQNPAASEGRRHCQRSCLSLVDLNGCLVSVRPDYRSKSIDMWVLVDLGKATWLRIQALRQGSVLQDGEVMAQPLAVADDGRIALWVAAPNGAVRVYDPRTGTCKNVVTLGKPCSLVGLYTGSLLSFME